MKPMKTTAVAVMLVGTVIGIYAMIMLFAAADSATMTQEKQAASSSTPIYLLVVAILALAGGVWMWVSGGRGAIVTRDPSVRN